MLVILLIVGLTYFPDQAVAQSASMEVMLSNFVKPVTQYIFDLFKQIASGLIYLLTASALFNFSISKSPEMLNLKDSAFVQTGISITTTIADILLIVVFITIALGTIFNVESINAKKHFIKFFVAALLIHFAPLFVGMLLDISNIIMGSIIIGGGDIFSAVFDIFFKDIFINALSLFALYSGGAVASVVLGWNILAGLGLVMGTLLLMIYTVPTLIVKIMVMNTLTGLLFSFAMFFLTRVFVIQILAILAPLAILAGVLPQTQHHFKTWVDWLTSWTLGGVLMLFLLTLGLSASYMIMPQEMQYEPPIFSFGTYTISFITSGIIYWIALAIYMMTVQMLCAAMIPKLSGEISSGITKGMQGMAGGIGKGISSGGRKSFQSGMEGKIQGGIKDTRASMDTKYGQSEEYQKHQESKIPIKDMRA